MLLSSIVSSLETLLNFFFFLANSSSTSIVFWRYSWCKSEGNTNCANLLPFPDRYNYTWEHKNADTYVPLKHHKMLMFHKYFHNQHTSMVLFLNCVSKRLGGRAVEALDSILEIHWFKYSCWNQIWHLTWMGSWFIPHIILCEKRMVYTM